MIGTTLFIIQSMIVRHYNYQVFAFFVCVMNVQLILLYIFSLFFFIISLKLDRISKFYHKHFMDIPASYAVRPIKFLHLCCIMNFHGAASLLLLLVRPGYIKTSGPVATTSLLRAPQHYNEDLSVW